MKDHLMPRRNGIYSFRYLFSFQSYKGLKIPVQRVIDTTTLILTPVLEINFDSKSLVVSYDIEMLIFPFLVYNNAFFTRMATLPLVPTVLSCLYMS